MWRNKKQKLKASYYRSFLALIVIPILLLIIISILIIRTMMVDSAIMNIRRAQDNLVSTLDNEVKDVSLRLSHFIYVNDNEIIKNAAGTNTGDLAERYDYTRLLTESFHYAMTPVQDILSAVFYMRDGSHIYLKDDVLLSKQELMESDWYQDALKEKNVVKVGFYDRSITNSRRSAHTLTIAAGLSPGLEVDRDGVIEMAALFASSQTGELIKNYNKEKLLGTTMIMNEEGEAVFDPGNAKKLLPSNHSLKESVFKYRLNKKGYVCVISREPDTGLLMCSVVEGEILTRDFTQAGAGIVAVTVVLFGLFYCFSAYFLKDIIGPIHNTVEGMRQVEEGDLEVHIEPKGQEELRLMIHSFNRMTRRLKQLIQENEEQQQKKHTAEIKALQSQINPHFLVNSLNSIRFIAQISKHESIARMAEALIRILSCSFRRSGSFYTIKEELEVLDGFIYLMKIRYSDAFDMEYHVEEDCLSCLLPRLILQPIVENSIVHGFDEGIERMGHIQIWVWREEKTLWIRIRDNGKGMQKEELSRLLSEEEKEEGDYMNIGVRNVKTRLILNYGQECSFLMDSREGEFTETLMGISVTDKREE